MAAGSSEHVSPLQAYLSGQAWAVAVHASALTTATAFCVSREYTEPRPRIKRMLPFAVQCPTNALDPVPTKRADNAYGEVSTPTTVEKLMLVDSPVIRATLATQAAV